MEILAGTSNKNKLAELSTIAETFGITLLSPQQAKEKYQLNDFIDCEETADTFQGNAILKAEYYCRWSNLPSLGDDSGIEIDALGGMPGIYSHRYAGENATDQQRIEKLLHELEKAQQQDPQKNRHGRFRCSLALLYPDGKRFLSEGVLDGEVLHRCQGTGGFGYDPILYIFEFSATLAEIDFSITCSRGFRAKAAKKLFAELTQA